MPHLDAEVFPKILHSPILIVEDNDINRIFLQKALQARGFTNLLAVGDAEEALDKIDRFQPELVILDIMLPGMNGFDCCAVIRQSKWHRGLPILIQTSLTEPELRVKAFAKGATDFISKPVYPEELCARVIVHLENRYSLKALQLYKSRIEAELESARQLQLAILPDMYDIEEIERICRLDIASYFQPSSEIGGDFWGVKNLHPHQTAFWLVDFSGHGVASALNAFRLQAYLKEHSSLMDQPGEYMTHLNDKLLHLLMQRDQFATMFYGVVDTGANRLLYACACAPHPIVLRGGKAQMIDGSGHLLGIGMHLYPTQDAPFAPGDMLLLYSDALIETPNAAGECISEQDIMTLMEKHPGASASAIKEIVLDYFKRHAAGTLRDDLTIVICARTST